MMAVLPPWLTVKMTTAASLEKDEMFIGADDRHFEVLEIDEPEGDGKRYIRFREVGTTHVIQGRVKAEQPIPRIHRVL